MEDKVEHTEQSTSKLRHVQPDDEFLSKSVLGEGEHSEGSTNSLDQDANESDELGSSMAVQQSLDPGKIVDQICGAKLARSESGSAVPNLVSEVPSPARSR